MHAMPVAPLIPSLRTILGRLSGGAQALVLLDFDATLVSGEADPAGASVPQPARETLRRLTENPRAVVGIASGRTVADLTTRLWLDDIVYAGSHGMEIRGRGLHFVEPFAFLLEPALKKFVERLAARLEELPNVRIEEGRLTARVHLAAAGEAERARAGEIVLALVYSTRQFRCRPARDAFDILPRNGWHKGKAAQWIRRELHLEDALIVYAGDATDEEAFAALTSHVTVKVGTGPTQAHYLADSPAEIWALLAQLEGALTPNGQCALVSGAAMDPRPSPD
jgi:trehalose-phosphatase